MVFNADQIIREQCPELIADYENFKHLKELNLRKLALIKLYLKDYDHRNIRALKRHLSVLKRFMIRDRREQRAEKRYTLIFLNKLKEKYDEGSDRMQARFGTFLKSLERLSWLISQQIVMVFKDLLDWQLRRNFQDFIRLVLEEQKIIEGDMEFLSDVDNYYRSRMLARMKKNVGNVLIASHRGAMGLHAENTLGSFKLALGTDAELIEFDAQRCKTGELVVIHDYKVDKLTNRHGLVRDLTLREILALKVNGAAHRERILTFEEVIVFISTKRHMLIEFKVHHENNKSKIEIAHKVDSILKKHNIPEDRAFFTSFDANILSIMKSIRPNCRIVPIFELSGASLLSNAWHIAKWKITAKLTFAKRLVARTKVLGAEYMGVPFSIIGESFIDYAHQNGIKVVPFSINDPYYMMKLIAWGVDGIITDRPDILSKIRSSIIQNQIPNLMRV